MQEVNVNGNVIPIMTFYEAQLCQEIALSKTIPKTIHQTILTFPFGQTSPFQDRHDFAFAATPRACLYWWSVVAVLVLVMLVVLLSAGLMLVVAGVILLLLLLLLCLWCRPVAALLLGTAGLVLGAAAAGGGGGGVFVQGEVGSRNDADVELGFWGGVCDKKRPACK